MSDTKIQPWDAELSPRPIRWSMPDVMDQPKKRNIDLGPYNDLIRRQIHVAAELDAGTENPEPDVPHGGDHHVYFEQFILNLAHIADWKQYEMLELLKQGVELAKVTTTWLDSFREDLDLKV